MTTSTTNGSRRNSEDKIELFDEYRGGIPKSLTIESEQPHASESKENTIAFNERMQRRRTVREFSPRPVPREIIESCIRAAGSAPNGANLQPWHFVAVANRVVKHEIRVAAEEEEREFYQHRAPAEWL
jgi:iodotyrosine deiodinase